MKGFLVVAVAALFTSEHDQGGQEWVDVDPIISIKMSQQICMNHCQPGAEGTTCRLDCKFKYAVPLERTNMLGIEMTEAECLASLAESIVECDELGSAHDISNCRSNPEGHWQYSLACVVK